MLHRATARLSCLLIYNAKAEFETGIVVHTSLLCRMMVVVLYTQMNAARSHVITSRAITEELVSVMAPTQSPASALFTPSERTASPVCNLN